MDHDAPSADDVVERSAKVARTAPFEPADAADALRRVDLHEKSPLRLDPPRALRATCDDERLSHDIFGHFAERLGSLSHAGVHFVLADVNGATPTPPSKPRALILANWAGFGARGSRPLIGALCDAVLIAEALIKTGFEVLVLQNVSAAEVLSHAVPWLVLADHALFYFAGHGGNMHGSNVLGCPDYEARDIESMKRGMLKVDNLVPVLNTPGKTRVMMLDCCRETNLSPDIQPQIAAQMPMAGMLISTAAMCGQAVPELPLRYIMQCAKKVQVLMEQLPGLDEYYEKYKKDAFLGHSTFTLFTAFRLLQDPDVGAVQLMRQVNVDSMCVLAHVHADMVLRSLVNSNGESNKGIIGGITRPMSTSSWSENLTLRGTPEPDNKMSSLVNASPPMYSNPSRPRVPISALVIGNGKYEDVRINDLPQAPGDGKAIARQLRRLGITVTEDDEKYNLTGKQILEVVKAFAAKLNKEAPGNIMLFYYAGHAFQIKGTNLFAGVDIKLSTLEPTNLELDASSMEGAAPLTEVINAALHSVSRLAVIMDACRDDPFAATRGVGAPLEVAQFAVPSEQAFTKMIATICTPAKIDELGLDGASAELGLDGAKVFSKQGHGSYSPVPTKVEQPVAMVKDFLVAYSSSPGEKAKDRNSYTETLVSVLEELKEGDDPDFEAVLLRTSRRYVSKQGAWTPPANGQQNKQVPWTLSILNANIEIPELPSKEAIKQAKKDKVAAIQAEIQALQAQQADLMEEDE